MIEIFQSVIQKKGARILQLTSLHHFIYNKKRLGLKRNLTFNQGTRKRFGALRNWPWGEGFWKFVRTSKKILATPLKNRACSLHPHFPGGLRPEVQPLTLLYTIFDRKETPFVYLSLTMALILLT